MRKLGLNHTEAAFADYDVLLSTSTRARDILDDAIERAKLVIIDEAHRVSPCLLYTSPSPRDDR